MNALPSLPSLPSVKASQRSFDLRIPTRRPLLPLKAAMVFLDRSEDDIDRLVDDSHLAGFDLSAPGAKRRWLVVWRQSCVNYKADGDCGENATVEEIIADCLPKRETLRATEVKALFSCNQGHLANLIGAGCLHVAAAGLGGTAAVRGPKSSPLVTRASVAKFLTDRRIV